MPGDSSLRSLLTEQEINLKSNRAYENAVRLLAKAKSQFVAAGQTDVWIAFLARLRAVYKAKRNFIAAAVTL